MSAKTFGIPDGTEVRIPLGKLKKSPKNARKTPHSEAAIEALAASIAVKGILLVETRDLAQSARGDVAASGLDIDR